MKKKLMDERYRAWMFNADSDREMTREDLEILLNLKGTPRDIMVLGGLSRDARIMNELVCKSIMRKAARSQRGREFVRKWSG